jgi:hypothetical protein
MARKTENNVMFRYVALAVLPILVGCVDDPRVAGLFGGEATFAAIKSAKSIEAVRIDGKKHDEKLVGSDTALFGYPITSKPVQLTPEQIKTLGTILANPGTYSFDIAKGCEFLPGVALQTTAGKQEVVILLCFGCDELAIYVGGKRVGHEDFDNARGKLAALMKQVFPKDDEIQSLK